MNEIKRKLWNWMTMKNLMPICVSRFSRLNTKKLQFFSQSNFQNAKLLLKKFISPKGTWNLKFNHFSNETKLDTRKSLLDCKKCLWINYLESGTDFIQLFFVFGLFTEFERNFYYFECFFFWWKVFGWLVYDVVNELPFILISIRILRKRMFVEKS